MHSCTIIGCIDPQLSKDNLQSCGPLSEICFGLIKQENYISNVEQYIPMMLASNITYSDYNLSHLKKLPLHSML